jgi:HEAT repeat protein
MRPNNFRFIRWTGILTLAGMTSSLALAAEPLGDALAQLKSPDLIKRRIAIQELVTLRNPASAPAVIEALKDKDDYVRTQAVRALGFMRYAAAGPQITRMLAEDKSREVRESAALSLRFINDPGAAPTLIKALKDPEESVRIMAIQTLAYFRNHAAAGPIAELAKDSSPRVRRSAITALGQLREAASQPTLVAALKDTDAAVRADAAQALGNLPGPLPADVKATLETLAQDTDPMVKGAAKEALAQQRMKRS